jgi:outer membrane protein assembly factor BamB
MGTPRRVLLAAALFAAALLSVVSGVRTAFAASGDWPRFRGPNGQGVAAEGARPPVEFGVGKNVAWAAELPPGISSPVVAAGRIYLTAFADKTLETICLDAATGKILWRRAAPAQKIEEVNSSNSPAASTPATDGERVYVYFGSFGLVGYDRDGKELWQVPVPTPQNMFGTATSPVVVGRNVVLVRDSDSLDSYMIAVDGKTGRQAWKAPRPLFKGSWSTPMLWRHEGVEELVVLGTGRVVAYDPGGGAERWSVSGFPQMAITTAVDGGGLLFAAKGGQGDPGQSLLNDLPRWPDLLKRFDADGDGKIRRDEVPSDYGFELRKDIPKGTDGNFLRMRGLIGMIDGDKDGAVGRFEWGMAAAFVAGNEDVLLAIKPGGEGDATDTHVAWRQKRGLPELPSPLFYNGRLYLVKNGGIVSCLDPGTGKSIYRERLGAIGPYYASPVAANGNIYAASEGGVVSVFKAGDSFSPVAECDLKERLTATPAVVGDTLFVRTDKHLYAFRDAGQ